MGCDEPGRLLLNEDSSALDTIATSVHNSLTLKEAYGITLHTVSGITAFDIAIVYLMDEKPIELYPEHTGGSTEEYIRKAAHPIQGVT